MGVFTDCTLHNLPHNAIYVSNVCTSCSSIALLALEFPVLPPTLADISHVYILAAGVTPQNIKAKNVIAEKRQKVISTKRSNSGENITVVATINAAGEVMPPLIIFKGQRVLPALCGAAGLRMRSTLQQTRRSYVGQCS